MFNTTYSNTTTTYSNKTPSLALTLEQLEKFKEVMTKYDKEPRVIAIRVNKKTLKRLRALS
jgi:hypothetical protein